MAALTEIKQEWRRFKEDRPGARFENHRQRMCQKPRSHRVLLAIVGGALVAAGIVFCFLPGPGSLAIVFGVALLGGMSRTIAHAMDRIEPRFRRGLEAMRLFWRGLSPSRRAALIALATVVVAMGVVVVWRAGMDSVVASLID